ncbi:MAG: hypothetical protein J1E16_01855 [Muribaculaceae bacterium]|nr:hypothetical protein [Muribaculaceae bacterium]
MFKKLGFYACSVMFMAMAWTVPANAQNAVKMTQGNNSETIFYLTDTPTVTFEDNSIVVVAKDNKVTCDLADGISFEFVSVDPGSVESVEKDTSVFKIDRNYIEAYHLTPMSQVVISDLSGKSVFSSKTDGNGYLYVETGSFPAGVYVFSSKDKNFKFYKK